MHFGISMHSRDLTNFLETMIDAINCQILESDPEAFTENLKEVQIKMKKTSPFIRTSRSNKNHDWLIWTSLASEKPNKNAWGLKKETP